MTKQMIGGVCALAIALAAGGAWAELKVAVVDMERVIRSHPDTKAKVAALEMQIQAFESEHDQMMKEREKRRESFEQARDEARSKALSEAAREEKVSEAEERLSSLREIERDITQTGARRQKQVQDEKIRIQREIIRKVEGVVEKFARERSLDLVLDSSNIGLGGVPYLMYADDALDVTDQVVTLTGGDPSAAEQPGDEAGKQEE